MYTNSIFEESWWLDAVAPGHWKELKVEQDGEIIARWPIVLSGKKMKMPKYTQTLGIWLNPDYIHTTVEEENAYLQLFAQLPKGVHGECSLAPQNTFYLPFVWNGFRASVGASYVLDDLSNLNNVFNKFSKNIKRDIHQAEKKLIVAASDDIDQLAKMSLDTYTRQGRAYIVKPDILRRIYQAAKAKDACTLLAALDKEGNIHSMALFVYDESRCYYLVGASDAQLNAKSCANTLLLWEGIKIASAHSRVFDFEGSEIQGIGTFFRRFGSTFAPYYKISKNDFLGDMYQIIKPRIKAILGHKK